MKLFHGLRTPSFSFLDTLNYAEELPPTPSPLPAPDPGSTHSRASTRGAALPAVNRLTGLPSATSPGQQELHHLPPAAAQHCREHGQFRLPQAPPELPVRPQLPPGGLRGLGTCPTLARAPRTSPGLPEPPRPCPTSSRAEQGKALPVRHGLRRAPRWK